MFHQGQRVVCIDDQFAPWVYDLYRALPQKNEVYTVRALGIGRSNPQFGLDDDAQLTILGAEPDLLVLLEELHNPDDPHSTIQQELGFRAERFAPQEEDWMEEEAVALVGVGQDVESWEQENQNPFIK